MGGDPLDGQDLVRSLLGRPFLRAGARILHLLEPEMQILRGLQILLLLVFDDDRFASQGQEIEDAAAVLVLGRRQAVLPEDVRRPLAGRLVHEVKSAGPLRESFLAVAVLVGGFQMQLRTLDPMRLPIRDHRLSLQDRPRSALGGGGEVTHLDGVGVHVVGDHLQPHRPRRIGRGDREVDLLVVALVRSGRRVRGGRRRRRRLLDPWPPASCRRSSQAS